MYCKIDTVIQLFRRVLAQGLYKTLDPLFQYQKNPIYKALRNRIFVLGLFEQISNAHRWRVPIALKNSAMIKTKERLE